MDNQQVSDKSKNNNTNTGLLFSNVDFSDIKHKKVDKIEDFVSDIHSSYDEHKKKYGLSRDESKRLKAKIFNKYEKSIPEEFEVCAKDPEYLVSKDGRIVNKRKRNELKQSLDGKGYPIISLGSKTTKVHRCVAETYIPNDDPVNKNTVNHKDGNKKNNNVENLEWCSNSENMKHAIANNLTATSEHLSIKTSGECNSQAKLTTVEAMDIKYNTDGVKAKDVTKLYGISIQTVRDIKAGRSWKFLP